MNMKKNKMVSITESTYNQLCANVELKETIDKERFKKYIFDDERLFYVFNKFEIQYLFNLKNLVNESEIDDFVFESFVGFDALEQFLAVNESFELEVVMAYLDQKNGIDTPFPKLPMLI